jgi:hypothetical protein
MVPRQTLPPSHFLLPPTAVDELSSTAELLTLCMAIYIWMSRTLEAIHVLVHWCAATFWKHDYIDIATHV